MVGIYTGTAQATAGAILTEERLEYYNGLVAPLSSILPPERQGGRQDPIALLGNQISRRNDEKKVRKAEKKLQKGEGKQLGKLETGLKWVSFLCSMYPNLRKGRERGANKLMLNKAHS